MEYFIPYILWNIYGIIYEIHNSICYGLWKNESLRKIDSSENKKSKF